MWKSISVLIFGMCWVAMLLTVLLTVWWGSLLVHAVVNGSAVAGFRVLGFMIYADMVGVGSLLLIVSNGILYFAKRQRRDWLSLCFALSSFVVLACEAVVILCIPATGAC